MKRKWIIPLIGTVAALTAAVSLFMIVSTLITREREQRAFDELAAVVEQGKALSNTPAKTPEPSMPSEKDPSPTVSPTVSPIPEPTVLPEYAALYEQNSDFFGWLRIDDTPVNYPVMFTPDDPEFYLNRSFDRKNSGSGIPFIDGACFEGCGNYLMYGHHMQNGTVFAVLPEYEDPEFWQEHKTIFFDTVYEHGEYEVIAAFRGEAVGEAEDGFRYYRYTDLTDPAVFAEYMEQVKAAAAFDTGLTAEYGDELITLSTCNYHTANGRFVVVAKRCA